MAGRRSRSGFQGSDVCVTLHKGIPSREKTLVQNKPLAFAFMSKTLCDSVSC